MSENKAIGEAALSYADDNGIPDDVIHEAGKRANEMVSDWDGFKITPKNVVSLLKPHVAAVLAERAAKGSKEAPPSDARGLSKVASPIGQGASGVRSPAALPAYLAEKPRDKWDDSDRKRYFDYLAAARRGPT